MIHYCANDPCDNEAVKLIVHIEEEGPVVKALPLCWCCANAYQWGQASPDAVIEFIEYADFEVRTDGFYLHYSVDKGGE